MLPLFVGVLCLFLVLLLITLRPSSFAIILMGKREQVAFPFAFLMSCDSLCSVALPQVTVGQSAVCDCGLS